MAEEESKTVVTKPVAAPRKRATKSKRVGDLQQWQTVTHDGRQVVVTAVDKLHNQAYLDSPVCSWVDVSDIKRD